MNHDSLWSFECSRVMPTWPHTRFLIGLNYGFPFLWFWSVSGEGEIGKGCSVKTALDWRLRPFKINDWKEWWLNQIKANSPFSTLTQSPKQQTSLSPHPIAKKRSGRAKILWNTINWIFLTSVCVSSAKTGAPYGRIRCSSKGLKS